MSSPWAWASFFGGAGGKQYRTHGPMAEMAWLKFNEGGLYSCTDLLLIDTEIKIIMHKSRTKQINVKNEVNLYICGSGTHPTLLLVQERLKTYNLYLIHNNNMMSLTTTLKKSHNIHIIIKNENNNTSKNKMLTNNKYHKTNDMINNKQRFFPFPFLTPRCLQRMAHIHSQLWLYNIDWYYYF